jgi:hypothetical protein
MRADRAILVLGALVGAGFGTVFADVGLAVASSDDARVSYVTNSRFATDAVVCDHDRSWKARP